MGRKKLAERLTTKRPRLSQLEASLETVVVEGPVRVVS